MAVNLQDAEQSRFRDAFTPIDAPGAYCDDVTPDNDNDLPVSGRGLYVGVAGNVKVTTVGGSVRTIPNLVAGVIHPMQIKRVWATSTTATGIQVWY